MRGHILVSLAVPGTLCGCPATKGWQGGDGRKGLSACIISTDLWEGGAIIKMPGLKAISSPGTTSLWRAASYRSCSQTTCFALQGCSAAGERLVFTQTLWKMKRFPMEMSMLKALWTNYITFHSGDKTRLMFPSHYECVNMDKPKVPLYSKCPFCRHFNSFKWLSGRRYYIYILYNNVIK